jgi:hypothetical protein
MKYLLLAVVLVSSQSYACVDVKQGSGGTTYTVDKGGNLD